MKIVVTGVFVDDQEQALRFYTDVLGFVKKSDIPMGPSRWLTADGRPRRHLRQPDPDRAEELGRVGASGRVAAGPAVRSP